MIQFKTMNNLFVHANYSIRINGTQQNWLTTEMYYILLNVADILPKILEPKNQSCYKLNRCKSP